MKKYFAFVAMVAAFTFGMTTSVMAQDEAVEAAEEQVDSVAVDSVAVDSVAEEAAAPEAQDPEDKVHRR